MQIKINGQNPDRIKDTINTEFLEEIYVTVGRAFVEKRRVFVSPETYAALNESQRKWLNLVTNRAYKS